MEVDINWAAVALATLASFVVGFIWYSPPVFGEMWRKLIGMKKETMQKGPAPTAWILTLLGAFLQAYVLAYVTYLSFTFFDNSWMTTSLMTAFYMWIGFQLSMILTHDVFEQRPNKLTMLTAGNQLATLLAMGLVIGIFQP